MFFTAFFILLALSTITLLITVSMAQPIALTRRVPAKIDVTPTRRHQ